MDKYEKAGTSKTMLVNAINDKCAQVRRKLKVKH